MSIRSRILLAAALAAGLAGPAAAETFPPLPVRTLSEQALQLPDDLPAMPVVIVVGFSHASRMQTRPWGDRLHEVYGARTDLRCYQVAVIEEVPRLVRGLVAARIRATLPQTLHDRFLLISEQMQAWKRLVDATQTDSAYLLLLDRERSIAWRSAGPLTEDRYAELAARIERVTAPAPTATAPARP